ncbi:MAG: geranylgeranyl reductase family protein [Candidatus Aenigmarchaeota archaeon]|nr:geranylgeranyl reductase family protein [Candidatus Aenigmarchaeota archaeon]
MEYDVIVLGGGPAGATAAMFLAQAGKNVCLIDKAKFPRDKTCGDAQGRKAANVMKKIGIYEEYEKLPGQKIYGITLSSPNGTQIEIDVEDRANPAPGYVHKRIVFDEFLFKNASKMVKVVKNMHVKDVIVENGYVKGVVGTNEKGQEEEVRAKLLLAADGGTSIVAAKFKLNDNPPEHFISAIRAYYTGVTGMTDRIEIHMVDELIPGYFWIFPLPNGEANVGLGMIVKDMAEKKINLKDAMIRALEVNPLFKDRFKNSELVGQIKGWNLPIASHHRKCYGNGFMLLGDAASLIDPLSGEGVGTAMISGEVSAKISMEALAKGDFSEKFLEKYDKELWDVIGDEIKTNYKIQQLGKDHPEWIDKLMVKASKDEKFRKLFESMLPYTGGRKKLGKMDFIRMFI